MFDSAGSPVDAELAVNQITLGDQLDPSIAAAPDGGFVVAWNNHFDSTGDMDRSVRARLFDASGAAISDGIQLNSFTAGSQAGSAPRAIDLHLSSADG